MLEVAGAMAALVWSYTDRAIGSSLIFKESLRRTFAVFAVREQELGSYTHFVQPTVSFLMKN